MLDNVDMRVSAVKEVLGATRIFDETDICVDLLAGVGAYI